MPQIQKNASEVESYCGSPSDDRALLKGSSLDLGWSHLVDDLVIREINGNHKTFLNSPHVGELAREFGELPDDPPYLGRTPNTHELTRS